MLINLHTHQKTEFGLEIVHAKEVLASPFSYGIAPFEVNQYLFDETICTHKNCFAIGEIGLDKTIQTDINKQIKDFKSQLIHAEELLADPCQAFHRLQCGRANCSQSGLRRR